MNKPIEQMSLAECLDALRFNPSGKTSYRLHTDATAELADRIDILTRWVPASERFPYEADAKGAEAIVWSNDGRYWKRIEKPEES